MIKGEGNLSFFLFPCTKDCILLYKTIIHLYKRKQSFVQDLNKYWRAFYYFRFMAQFYKSENTN